MSKNINNNFCMKKYQPVRETDQFIFLNYQIVPSVKSDDANILLSKNCSCKYICWILSGPSAEIQNSAINTTMVHQVVSNNKTNDAKNFRLKNYLHTYINRFKFVASRKIQEIALCTTKWCRVSKQMISKYSTPKVTSVCMFIGLFLVPCSFNCIK
jgi:hypothetical protein